MGRFAYGVEYILRREGLKIEQGLDGGVYGNIPGRGGIESGGLGMELQVDSW